jgi:hypothetical protein
MFFISMSHQLPSKFLEYNLIIKGINLFVLIPYWHNFFDENNWDFKINSIK